MSESLNRYYDFGPFRVDRTKRRLLREQSIVPITPKAFDTLLVLIEHAGQLVEKNDLIGRVWPGIAVEENNLTQNISSLRKALGEKREQPQYILTAPGIGYRFIAPVSKRANDASANAITDFENDYDSIRNSPRNERSAEARSNWLQPRTVI